MTPLSIVSVIGCRKKNVGRGVDFEQYPDCYHVVRILKCVQITIRKRLRMDVIYNVKSDTWPHKTSIGKELLALGVLQYIKRRSEDIIAPQSLIRIEKVNKNVQFNF